MCTLISTLYKVNPDPDQDLEKKQTDPGPLEKADPIAKFIARIKNSFLTNSRVLISNMAIVFLKF